MGRLRGCSKQQRQDRENPSPLLSLPTPALQERGIGAFASKYQPQPFDGEDDRWSGSRVFRSCSGRLFGGAGVPRVAQTRPNIHQRPGTRVAEVLCRLSSQGAIELDHVVIMFTRGRVQRLVLKAAEPERLEVRTSLNGNNSREIVRLACDIIH